MLTEKQEEIMEAIWCAGENENYSMDAIKERCVVDFTEEDMAELETEGLIVRDADKIMFSSAGKLLAEAVMRRHRLAEVLVSSILRLKILPWRRLPARLSTAWLPKLKNPFAHCLGIRISVLTGSQFQEEDAAKNILAWLTTRSSA